MGIINENKVYKTILPQIPKIQFTHNKKAMSKLIT